ncbi:MAG: glycosyltransferase [Thermodesulfobacteriota bacterium]|nr:glycosyltransferase [Thermodesulfobacteriota bacterium]
MRASVIVPFYNNHDTILTCLQSIKEQDFIKDDYEIIVVDDGSHGDTGKLVQLFNLKLLRQKHKGPAAARNLGAWNAKGEIIVFIDADCLAGKDWLKKMLEPFLDPDVKGVQGAYKTQQKEIIARFAQCEIEERYRIMEKNHFIDFIGTYSAAYRNDIFIKMGGFDESFPIASGEDTDFSYRLSKENYKLVFNPEAIVYHNHPDRFPTYLKQKFWRAYWRNLIYSKNIKKAIKDTYTPQILKFQIFLFLLFFILLIASPFNNFPSFPIILSVLGLFFITTIPFIVKTIFKDPFIGCFSPFFIFFRSAVFTFGIIMGFIRIICLRQF